jgi:predicted Zn finger-like uncharacterized protein
MIIQCEQCQTKFRLDDSKVTDKGVKVRCAKCKHVFSVRRDQPETEPQTDFGALLDQSVSFDQEEETSSLFGGQPESPATEPQPGSGFDYSDFIAEDFSRQDGPTAAASHGLPADAPPASAPVADDFSLSSLDGALGFVADQDETPPVASVAAFSGLDFGGDAPDADKTEVATAPVPESAATTGESTAFTFDEEPSFGDAAPFPETGMTEDLVGFDAPPGGFDDSGAEDFALVDSMPADSQGEDTFSMGEIDFNGEPESPAVQQAHPDSAQPAEDQPVALSAPAVEKPLLPVGQESDQKDPEAEAPPLSIASRRKYNPVFNIVIAVATVVAVAVLGFLGYSMFQEGKEKVVAETGRITVRAVNASFVKNPEIGDLLVITGEAVNAFSKPRAAIKIKGTVFGPNGQVLATKTAYCGNPLTKEQLAGMPLEKIEAAMANQFGDSLANLEVAPGKTIPFVIVIAKPPAEAKDYGVEPSGSTVATGKAQ